MIQLSDHFNYKRLIRYTVPSILMMIFTSIYGVVDGYFVSNYTGKTPFAAVNFIMPVLIILGCVGFMFGTGSSALISKTMGEGDGEKANRIFTFVVVTSVIIGTAIGVLGIIFLRPIGILLGGEGQLLDDSVTYGTIILIAQPFWLLQYEFQCLFPTAGKPRLGLYVTVAAGVTNMVLDALFVAVFGWGLVGAAVATALSQFVGGIVPVIYFFNKNNSSSLRFTKFGFDAKVLLKTCTNGSSELMSSISMSIVSMLYNYQLMKYAGENGIAAYGVLMYVSMIFQALFIGYSVGSAPIIGYHFGAENKKELSSLLRKSLILIGTCSLFMFAAGELLSMPLSRLFISYDEALLKMTHHAFTIFSFSFLFSGIAIYGSSFFTALNDGVTSALISFFRTIVFQVCAVLIFPLIWQLDGVWISISAAEVAAVAVTGLFLAVKRKKYGY